MLTLFSPSASATSPPMSRRKSSWSKPTFPPHLSRLELHCTCKLTMRPRCLVGKLPGCRDRRGHGKRCECPVKLLPVCVLKEGIGCADRQLGKRCSCKQAMMPSCFALGCAQRKKGRNCQCPRTPGEPCKHVLALARRRLFSSMTPEQLDHFVRWWANRLSDFDEYMEPLLPAPDVATTQESRIVLMEARENLGVGLWHPLDMRSPQFGQEEELQVRHMVDFIRLIQKGGGYGAA